MAEPAGSGSGPASPSPWSYVGLGFEIVVPLIVGVFLGDRLDRWLGTRPWLLVAGALLGMAAGFLTFFRAVLPRSGRGGGGGKH